MGGGGVNGGRRESESKQKRGEGGKKIGEADGVGEVGEARIIHRRISTGLRQGGSQKYPRACSSLVQ